MIYTIVSNSINHFVFSVYLLMLLKNFALASILLISLYFFDRDLDNLIYFDRKMKE